MIHGQKCVKTKPIPIFPACYLFTCVRRFQRSSIFKEEMCKHSLTFDLARDIKGSIEPPSGALPLHFQHCYHNPRARSSRGSVAGRAFRRDPEPPPPPPGCWPLLPPAGTGWRRLQRQRRRSAGPWRAVEPVGPRQLQLGFQLRPRLVSPQHFQVAAAAVVAAVGVGDVAYIVLRGRVN